MCLFICLSVILVTQKVMNGCQSNEVFHYGLKRNLLLDFDAVWIFIVFWIAFLALQDRASNDTLPSYLRKLSTEFDEILSTGGDWRVAKELTTRILLAVFFRIWIHCSRIWTWIWIHRWDFWMDVAISRKHLLDDSLCFPAGNTNLCRWTLALWALLVVAFVMPVA